MAPASRRTGWADAGNESTSASDTSSNRDIGPIIRKSLEISIPPSLTFLVPWTGSGRQHRIHRPGQRLRIIERVVEPPALLAVESGADDQLGGLEQVAELDQVGGDPEMAVIILDLLGQHLDPVLGALKPLGGADDADIFSHKAVYLGPF